MTPPCIMDQTSGHGSADDGAEALLEHGGDQVNRGDMIKLHVFVLHYDPGDTLRHFSSVFSHPLSTIKQKQGTNAFPGPWSSVPWLLNWFL